MIGAIALGVHGQERRLVDNGIDGLPGHHAVPKVRDDDDVIVRRLVADHFAQGCFQTIIHRRVVEVVDLKQLAHAAWIDKTAFPGCWCARPIEERRTHTVMQTVQNEVFVGFLPSQACDDFDLGTEVGHVIGSGDNAAGKYFAPLRTGRDDVFLSRLAHRRGVLIFIDDGIANHQNL